MRQGWSHKSTLYYGAPRRLNVSGVTNVNYKTPNMNTVAPKASNVFNLKLPDWCDTKPCMNLGKCTATPDMFICVCATGFYGDRCEFDAMECVNNPCLNNGLCMKSSSTLTGYSCQCLAGFVGTICESQTSLMNVPPPESVLLANPLAAGIAVAATNPTPVRSYIDIVGGYFYFTIIVCSIVILIAFVCTVETERKCLVDQYKMITEVGYDTEFPQIDFLTVASRRVRNALRSIFCCSRGFEEAKVPLLGTRPPLVPVSPGVTLQLPVNSARR